MDECENCFEEGNVEAKKYGVEEVKEVKKAKAVKDEKVVKEEKKYYKDSFASSESYKKYIDVVTALLEEDTLYSKAEVDDIIESFLRMEVI